MVARQTLDLEIGVQIPAPEPCRGGGTVDALRSERSGSNPVEVQILSAAPLRLMESASV